MKKACPECHGSLTPTTYVDGSPAVVCDACHWQSSADTLPGDRPEEVGPSGVYGFRVVAPMTWEREEPVVQVVEATNGRQWIATPARYYAEDVAGWSGRNGLAIDMGMGWFLPTEDVRPFVAFARRVLAEDTNG